jgi:hypothetical protein
VRLGVPGIYVDAFGLGEHRPRYTCPLLQIGHAGGQVDGVGDGQRQRRLTIDGGPVRLIQVDGRGDRMLGQFQHGAQVKQDSHGTLLL